MRSSNNKKGTKGYVDGIILFGQNALKISFGPL